MTHRRIRWEEILSYARRFAEYDIIRAIRPQAERLDVPLRALTAKRLRGRAVAVLGPLSVGTDLGSGWRVTALALDASARVEAARNGDPAVTFAVEGTPVRGAAGPFDAPPVRISYEHTDVPFADFRSAGETLRDLLVADAPSHGGIERAFGAWIAAASQPAAAATVDARRLADSEALEIRADGKLYLRITDSCQERCVFCFFYDSNTVDNLVRHHDLEPIIARVDAQGIQQVVLTGGEPTLHPRLPDYVQLLSDKGFSNIILQTNGIRLSEPGYLERLLPFRDRLGIGFSLHAVREQTNDDLTTVSRHYFPQKIEAVRRAAALGFRTKITLVMNRDNLAELVDFVELCASLTAGADSFVQFSLPSFEGRMNLFLETYPRLSEIARTLPPALRRAREIDLRASLCHQCQVPPCVVPDDVRHLESLWFEEAPAMWSHDRAYGPECASCAMRPWCSGVWEGYARHFGTGDLVPFAPDEVEPHPTAVAP